MPTTVLTMLATGFYNAWGNTGGADKMVSVNSDNADTSYINEGTSGDVQAFTLTGYADIPATAPIEKIEHSMKIREEVGTHGWGVQGGLRLGGVDQYGTQRATTVSYALFTEEIARPGGGAWSKDDLATLEWLARTWGTADGHSQRLTYGYITVTWLDVVEIPQPTHVASHRLLQQAGDDHRMELRVPLWIALKLELLDRFNVSHDALLRSASHLANIDFGEPEGLFDRWRRQLVDLVAVTEHYREREATLTFLDLEQFIATYFCSERLVGATEDTFPKLAQMDVGGQLTASRTTAGYMLQESTIVSTQGRGTFIGRVLPHVAKRNHLGLLCEDAGENIVPRSVFDSGLTGWTSVLNSGTTTAGTTRKYFTDGITTQSIAIARANNAANTYIEAGGLSVNAADEDRRVAFIYSTRGTTFVPAWQLQRASDSWYWNDSSGAWQAGAVWNVLPTTWDATNSLELASYVQSKAILTDVTTTWTIRFGLETGTTPVGGATVDVGYIGIHKGRARYSPIPTFGSTVATGADTLKDVLEVDVSDPVRQLLWADHYTVEVSILADQDVDDLVLESKHCIWYAQYGTTGKDYDAVTYEKPLAGAARFTFESWRDIAGTSTLDARATLEVDIVRGSTYHVTARKIGTDQELGLTALMQRLRVNDANGVDDVAAAFHSPSEKHTELWFGCAPAATGFLRAMNTVFDYRFQPRVITDEETR